MLLQFSYKKSSVINALRFHFLNRGEIKVFRITLLILFFFTVIGNLFRLIPLRAVIIVFVMIVVLLIVFWYLLPLSIYGKAATFKESIRLEYDEDGIIIGTSVGEKKISWNKFDNVVETNDFFYLYRDKKSFFLVPADAFKDDASRQSFVILLQSKFQRYYLKK